MGVLTTDLSAVEGAVAVSLLSLESVDAVVSRHLAVVSIIQ